MQQQAREGTSLAKDTLTQRVGGLVAIPALLREFGVEPSAVLAKVKLTAEALEHIDSRISFEAADGLLGECVASTGCAHFGLLVGQRWGLSQFGALGELMRHSGTVGEALRCMAVHQYLNSDVGAVFLLEQEGTVSMGYALYRNNARHPEQVYDTALAITRNLLRELCGSRWGASEVTFSRPQPVDHGPYRQHFQAPLRFDRGQSAVRFPARWQELRLPGADAERCRALTTMLEAADTGGQLVSRLQRALRLLLLAGKSSGDELAQTLSLHRRTLSRRLRAQGTTFQRVLDDVRFEVSCHLLEHTGTPIDQIATALCYGDVSAFMHAFRRWSGTTPALWRKAGARR